MRVLHVCPYMHPSAGGPPVVVESFVRELVDRGHSAEILSTAMFCKGDEDALLDRLNGIAQTSFLPKSWIRLLRRSGLQSIEQSVARADIVHLHTLWSPFNAIVRNACFRHRKPFVVMPHGMLDPYSLSVRRWRKALYLWAIERNTIASAQRMIYTTAEEARLAATQISQLPEGVVVPLGGDAPDGKADELASAFLEQFPKARGRRQLLFLGRLHAKKGLDRILIALPGIIRTFPNVLLTVVGNGAPQFQAMLTRGIADQNLEDHVLMTGSLDGASKWGAYASAELFLLPSRQENFAITVAEAMQMGVPVIISNKVNTWPYVNEAGAGLVLDEEDIEAKLEADVVSLLSDVERRKLMGRRGRAYARASLTWAQAATSLMKCYDDVLASAQSDDRNR